MASALATGSHRHAAFAMSLGAGAATGIGACFVLCTTSLDRRLLACTMAFSAGVMMYVSFAEILVKSQMAFQDASVGPSDAYALATLCFFGGFATDQLFGKFNFRLFLNTQDQRE